MNGISKNSSIINILKYIIKKSFHLTVSSLSVRN